MQLEGTVIHCLPVRQGTSARGDWKAQDFVIETTDQFTRKMVFSVWGEDRLQRFNIQEGQYVSVSFDIDAREYQGRWFNTIRAYDVRPVTPGQQNPAPMPGEYPPPPFPQAPAAPAAPGFAAGPVPPAAPAAPAAPAPAPESEDDLPF